jgi:hypothetical protein
MEKLNYPVWSPSNSWSKGGVLICLLGHEIRRLRENKENINDGHDDGADGTGRLSVWKDFNFSLIVQFSKFLICKLY